MATNYQQGGVSYSGFKSQSILGLNDPVLSKVLQEGVHAQVRLAQFAKQVIRMGEGHGNTYEVALANDDPSLDIMQRTLFNDLDVVKTTNLTFSAHSFSSREFGISVKYNLKDIAESEYRFEDYVRSMLARDVARQHDTMVDHEMCKTPYRYIPFNEEEGACADTTSYAFKGLTGTAPATVAAATWYDATSAGKIVPGQTITWGSDLICNLNADPNAPVARMPNVNVATERAWVAAPMFIAAQAISTDAAKYVPGPLANATTGQKTPVAMHNIDPMCVGKVLDPNFYPIPKLTLQHLKNMVAFAGRLQMLSYDRLKSGGSLTDGYVGVGPTAQIAALIDSLSYLSAGAAPGGIIPTTMAALNDVPNITGPSFRVPGLAIKVVAVVDDYVPLNLLAMYGQDPRNAALQDHKLLGSAQTWATQFRNPWGAVLDVTGVKGTTNVGLKRAAAFAATEVGYRTLDQGLTTQPITIKNYLPVGFGPFYLFGKDSVQELVNEEESIRRSQPQDFDRIGGLAWVMRKGWKNTWTPKYATNCWGMPVKTSVTAVGAATTIGDAAYDAQLLVAYKRNRIIKFDWPTWVQTDVGVTP